MPSSKPISAPAPFIPDEHQRAAIEHVQGPLLVIAGAGTGKTTVLTRRIARLIREHYAQPEEILALTYTENAAAEMRERVVKELGTNVALPAMTFHAYCFRLLAESGKQFAILDDKDLWILLRKRIRDLHLKHFIRAANVSKFLDDLLDFMRRCQDELVGPEQYAAYVQKLNCGEASLPRVTKSKEVLPDEELLGRCQEISSVYTTVEHMLAEQNLGTFGHMITRAHELLCADSELLARERSRARFVLVDEFQDANFAQVKILELLSGNEQNIFAVGDPDQAIYRFRGASSAAFGLFQLHFPSAKVISLDRNQRSLEPILRCAHALITHNPPVLTARANGRGYQRRPLISAREQAQRSAVSDLVQVVEWRQCELESADLVSAIRKKQKQLRCPWDRFAVIYRTHLHRDAVVEELSRYRIPYSIEGLDVLDTSGVRDLLACLGAVVSIADSGSLFRVIALPQFEIDPEILRNAIKAAGRDVPLATVLEKVQGGPEVLTQLQAVHSEIQSKQLKVAAALKLIQRYFQLPQSPPSIRAVLAFAEAWEIKPVTETGSCGEFIEYLEYFREARGTIPLSTGESDAVHLMTAHAAKGLEFDHVFIIRATSNSFPASYREPLFEFPRDLRDPTSVAEEEGKKLNDQEERRLFYVAMTRARDSLTIYGKQGTGKDSSPPGFLRELLNDRDLATSLLRRNAKAMQVDLFGEAAQELPQTNLSAWLTTKPGFLLTSRLSATAIELYKTCPLQFKLEREWRIPGEIPAAMQYGASIHRALRTFGDAIRFHREMSDQALLDHFRTDLREAKIDDPYQRELYENQGLQQLGEFLQVWRQHARPEILETEKEFQLHIGSARIVGRIDRMDQATDSRVVIIDYKTGKPRSQEDADESLQLSLYAIAARECWQKIPDRLVFYNLETNTAVSTTRSDLQLEEAKAEVEEVAGKIVAGEFDPTPGFHCGFCAYRRLCPATEKQLFPDELKKKTQTKVQ